MEINPHLRLSLLAYFLFRTVLVARKIEAAEGVSHVRGMLRLTLHHFSKRTPGYVFWRQSTLVELEHARRNYLLSERPLPIADIARRMVRVRSRYLETRDFNEKNLLRGEYKYFSGKLCDIRHARPEDMVSYVECGSFFGFWDAAQMTRVLQELLLKVDELGPVELLHLFTSPSPLRGQAGELYFCITRRLVSEISNLSVDECIRVCTACDETTPHELVRSLVCTIGPMVSKGELTPAQCVEVMDALGASCLPACGLELEGLLRDVKRVVVSGMTDLSVSGLAVACTFMRLHGNLDTATQKSAVRLFTSRLDEACASSTAMMFTATGGELTSSQLVGERVVFLATDFTPGELLSVFAVYINDFISTLLVSGEGSVTADVVSGMSKNEWCAGNRAREPHVVCQHQTAILRVVRELMDQMLLVLESASAYVSPTSQLQYVTVFYWAAEDIGDVERLAKHLPSLNRCMELLSSKIIACMIQYSYFDLVALLRMCDRLGRSLTNAAVVAVVCELTRREVSVSGSEAKVIYTALRNLSGLRVEHRTRIERDLFPRLLKRCSNA